VRIADEDGKPLNAVYLALTDFEARQLHDFLEQLMEPAEKGFHAHITDERFWVDSDAEQVEKEITIYRADDETAVF
jgi:hypothetical protein